MVEDYRGALPETGVRHRTDEDLGYYVKQRKCSAGLACCKKQDACLNLLILSCLVPHILCQRSFQRSS